jgi:hypothetical protein
MQSIIALKEQSLLMVIIDIHPLVSYNNKLIEHQYAQKYTTNVVTKNYINKSHSLLKFITNYQ